MKRFPRGRRPRGNEGPRPGPGLAAAAVLVLLLSLSPGPAAGGSPPSFEEVLKGARAAYDRVEDYTCTFNRKELVDGEVIGERNILMKFRKPHAVYLRWTEGSRKGSEALYVRGRYDDKLIAHTGGLLGFITVRLDPRGAKAMKGNRHPVTEAGIGHLLDLIGENLRRAKENGDEGGIRAEEDMGGASVFRAVFPPGKGYYAHDIRIRYDDVLRLPVKVTVLGWDNELLEEYEYEGIRVNVGLMDSDFDPDNPCYGF